MSDPNADHEFDLTHDGQVYSIACYNVRDDDDGSLLYDVVVRSAGGAVVLEDDFVVVNPPILAPDGTYRTEYYEDGTSYQAENMVEDLVAAFEIVTRQIVALRLGAA